MASKPAKPNDQQWIAEAIVDFLRGPLYVNPLMEFIDQHCDIFTPEQENKLEYTTVHQEFQARVDELLTNFLEELGVSADEFYRVAEQSTDKLTSFVVQTILTVDDFCLFKAMMVKRNTDLGNQVLEAVDQLKAAVQKANSTAQDASIEKAQDCHAQQPTDENEALQQAIQMSKAEYEKDAQISKLQQIMRSLQLQDEDVATAIAIAESLKDAARQQSEAAEIEQAFALSLALKAEQKRLATSEQAAKLAGGISSLEAGPSAVSKVVSNSENTVLGTKPAAGNDKTNISSSTGDGSTTQAPATHLLSQPLPEPTPSNSTLPVLAAGIVNTSSSASSLPPLKPSNPISASTDATRLAAIATIAAEAASLLGGNGYKAQQGLTAEPGVQSGTVNVGSSTAARPTLQETRTSETGSFARHAGVHARPLGFKGTGSTSSGTDKTAVWEAAAAAAATQKNLVSGSRDGADKETDAATAWLQDAKKQLIEKKRQEREAEMNAYQATKANNAVKNAGATPAAQTTSSTEDARRAALRDKLAQRFRQDLINQSQ